MMRTAIKLQRLMVFSMMYKVRPSRVKCNRCELFASMELYWYLGKKWEPITMKTILCLVWFLAAGLMVQAQEQNPPSVGDAAPDFTLPYATKDSIAKTPLKLADLIGKRAVVIAFYPADWSTGCTKEVCTLRDNFGALQSLDAEILAISGDYVWSHHEWAKFHSLPFRLLSDHSHAVARLYGSLNEKSLYNRRTVFVINRQGKIAYANLTYSVADQQDFDKLRAALTAAK